MNLTNIFTSELPLGKTILLAWLTAAFLNVQWGVTISIRDVPPEEFLLEAGLLFGYFITLMSIGRLLAFLVLMLSSLIYLRIIIREAPLPLPDPLFTLRHDTLWRTFLRWFGNKLVNFADVAAMFAAFFLYSERMLNRLAPIGLGIALVLYIFGRFDSPTPTTSSPNNKGSAG